MDVLESVAAASAAGATGTRVVAVAVFVGAELPAAFIERTRYEYDDSATREESA